MVLGLKMKKSTNTERWIGTKRYVRFFIFLLLVGAVGGCGSYSTLFWQTASKEDIHVLVPNGYEGRVLIAWQVPEGSIAEKEGDAWQYQLQEDGALLLQNDPPQEIGRWSFWYEQADGTLKPIPPSTCFDDAQEEGVAVCTGMIAVGANEKELRPNVGFTITTLEDYLSGKWDDEEFFRLRNRYYDQLVLPEGE